MKYGKPIGGCLHCDTWRLINGDLEQGVRYTSTPDEQIVHSLFEVMGDMIVDTDNGSIRSDLMAFFKRQFEVIVLDIESHNYKTEQLAARGRSWTIGRKAVN